MVSLFEYETITAKLVFTSGYIGVVLADSRSEDFSHPRDYVRDPILVNLEMVRWDRVMLTDEVPFAARLVRRQIDDLPQRGEVDLVAVVGPGAELHFAVLVVEGKPLDVDGAGGDVEAERQPRTVAVVVDDDVRRILAVDVLVGTVRMSKSELGDGGYVKQSIRKLVSLSDCLCPVCLHLYLSLPPPTA